MNILQQLSETAGISSSYIDKTGNEHQTPDSTRRFFLKAMGLPSEDEKQQEEALANLTAKPLLPDTLAFYDNEDFELPIGGTGSYELEITDESAKTVISQEVRGNTLFALPKLSHGYYTVTLKNNDETKESLLIIAPEKCYMPDWLKKGEHLSGVSLMIYSLRSKRSLGVGDFADLKKIIELTAQNGGDVIGINPLGVMSPKMLPHPLFAALKGDISPYRTLSRLFINPLYIAIETEPDFINSPEAKSLMASPEVVAEIRRLNEADKVQYAAMMTLKKRFLELMYQTFNQTAAPDRKEAFMAFKKQKGQALENLCLFEALLDHHKEETFWRLWQDGTGNFNSYATKAFHEAHEKRIDFYAYCHWLADTELKALQQYALDLGMKIGLYADMPIGAASNGAEVWEDPSVYVLDAGVGAPADPMRPKGQSWGFTPYHPQKLAQKKYAPFIALVRENVNTAGALRIDHAMGLRRLFWSFYTKETPVVQGAYIYYDIKILTAILCLESNRARCLMIGEDLGTVPDGFREYMAAHGLLSYKVFFRQKEKDGTFIAPKDYMYMSLAQSSTHDQATTSGFWQNEDIEVFKSCGLYVNEDQYQSNLTTRRKDRENMIKAFAKEALLSLKLEQEMANSAALGNSLPDGLKDAVNLFGAKTNSALYLVRLCDLCGQKVLENAPGTIDEYPNWRTKLPKTVEEITSSEALAAELTAIKAARPK